LLSHKKNLKIKKRFDFDYSGKIEQTEIDFQAHSTSRKNQGNKTDQTPEWLL
jgi:hypothetical protein